MSLFWSPTCRRSASAWRRWTPLLALAACCAGQATAQPSDATLGASVAVDEGAMADVAESEPLVAYHRDEHAEEPDSQRFDVESASTESMSPESLASESLAPESSSLSADVMAVERESAAPLSVPSIGSANVDAQASSVHSAAARPVPDAGDDARRVVFSSATGGRASGSPSGSPSRAGAARSLLDRLATPPGARGALLTAATGLGAVVALLLVSTWALKRRHGPTPGILPPEAFSMLGRAQLADRTVVQLFRLGNKLVLAAPSPEGLRPLTEITDPQEVDRIAGICARGRLHGPAAEFQQVLAQLAREPARGFLGGEARSR